MTHLLHTAAEFLRQQGWSFSQVEGRTVLQFGFTGTTASWNCYLQAQEPEARLLCYSVVPFQVPDPSCPAVAELITRANYGLVLGNFELDMDDGEVRYKTSIDVGGGSITVAQIRTLVLVNLRATNRYLAAIRAVIDGVCSPAEAIAELERNAAPPALRSSY